METEGKKRHGDRMQFGRHEQNSLLTYSAKDIILSKDWTARGRLQRIGASIFAVILLLGAAALLTAGVLLWAQVSNVVLGILGRVLGTILALFPFFVAYGLTFFAFRLIKGIGRSLRK